MRRVVSVLAAAVFLAVVFVPVANAAPSAYIVFRNAESGMCMSAEGGRMANGTRVIQYSCNESSDQAWIEQDGQLKSRKDPSFCLSVPNNWTSIGVQLIIWRCQGATGQRWQAATISSQPVIYNTVTQRIVSVKDSSHALRAPLVQWTWSHMYAKIWFPKYVIDG